MRPNNLQTHWLNNHHPHQVNLEPLNSLNWIPKKFNSIQCSGNFFEGSSYGSKQTIGRYNTKLQLLISQGSLESTNSQTSIKYCQKFLESFDKAIKLVKEKSPPIVDKYNSIIYESITSNKQFGDNYLSKPQYFGSGLRKDEILSHYIESTSEKKEFRKVESYAIESKAFNCPQSQTMFNRVSFGKENVAHQNNPTVIVTSKDQSQWWNQIEISQEQRFKSISSNSVKVYDSITLSAPLKSESFQTQSITSQASPYKNILITPYEPIIVSEVSFSEPTNKIHKPIVSIIQKKNIIAFKDALIMLLILIIFTQLAEFLFLRKKGRY